MRLPVAVPLCATCGTPYVLRCAFVMTGPAAGEREWLYQLDCRHKARGRPPVDGTAALVVPSEP